LYQFGFEKLEVWQLSKDLCKDIYKLTKKFPVDERYGITAQLNRSVISVPANIAEGSARLGLKEKQHFYSIAYGSLMEVASFLIIAKDLNYINVEKLGELKEQISKISNKLNALYQSQNAEKRNSAK
jgi:four helix bundle protein